MLKAMDFLGVWVNSAVPNSANPTSLLLGKSLQKRLTYLSSCFWPSWLQLLKHIKETDILLEMLKLKKK